MQKLFAVISLAAAALLGMGVVGISFAEDSHMTGHGAHSMAPGTAHQMTMDATEVIVDANVYAFMAMKNEMHRGMLDRMKIKEQIESGTTHNVMIVLRQTDESVPRGTPAKIEVIGPDGRQEIKKAQYKEMMKSYDAYFSLDEKGKYRITLMLFPEGADRSIGVAYELR